LISPLHQARYRLNTNYVAIVKQDIDKLLVVGFIKLIEEATWLSPIVVMLKKIWKTNNLCRFKKIEWCCHQERSIPLPSTNEVINSVVGHEVYTFLDG
jgi:hypothetical protein